MVILGCFREGIDFLGHHPGLGDNCCFIAMEAVTWLQDRVSGVSTRRDAIKILQVCSNYSNSSFISGTV